MRPIKTATSNHNYGAPPGMEDQVGGLPCRVVGAVTASVWELTDQERRLIIDGANLQLSVWGHPHPVVALEISHEQALET